MRVGRRGMDVRAGRRRRGGEVVGGDGNGVRCIYFEHSQKEISPERGEVCYLVEATADQHEVN